MEALLLYTRFPQSFWSYERVMEMAGFKAVIPPLGRERITRQLGYAPLAVPRPAVEEPMVVSA